MYVPLTGCKVSDLVKYQAETLGMLPEPDVWLNTYAREEFARASTFIDGLLAALLVRCLAGESVANCAIPDTMHIDAEVQATCLVHYLVQSARAELRPLRAEYQVSIFSLHLLHNCISPSKEASLDGAAALLGTAMSKLSDISRVFKEDISLGSKNIELENRLREIQRAEGMRCWWMPNYGPFWDLGVQ